LFVGSFVDEDERFTVALVNRSGPIDIDGKVQTIERHAVE